MARTNPATRRQDCSNPEAARERTPVDRILDRLSSMDLQAKEHIERYMRHKWRVNHKRRTIEGSFTSIMLFLEFYGASGKTDITRSLHRARTGPGIEYLNRENTNGFHHRLFALPYGTGHYPQYCPQTEDQAQTP